MTTDGVVRPRPVSRCEALSYLIPHGSENRLQCLLVAPHEGYLHYAVFPGDPGRFWMWTDEDAVGWSRS